MSIPIVLHRGVLHKKSPALHHRWQRRSFVLRADALLYFDEEAEHQTQTQTRTQIQTTADSSGMTIDTPSPRGIIPLCSVSEVIGETENPRVFQIHVMGEHHSRTFVLRAESDVEGVAWVDALRQAVDDAKELHAAIVPPHPATSSTTSPRPEDPSPGFIVDLSGHMIDLGFKGGRRQGFQRQRDRLEQEQEQEQEHGDGQSLMDRSHTGYMVGESESHARDWAREFQETLSKASGIFHAPFALIRRLEQDMLETAHPLVQSLVEDMHKSVDLQRIRATPPFIARGLLVRLWPDRDSPAQTSDDRVRRVMKDAGHEYRSLHALTRVAGPFLSLPLAACFTYRGHRIMVSSVPPVSSTTLAQGLMDDKDDATATFVSAADPVLTTLLKRVCDHLNLKQHRVGRGPGGSVDVLGSVDFQGHVSSSGRYYAANTGRLFPLFSLDPRVPHHDGPYASRLRPECVAVNPVPLNSDAFTEFGDGNDEQAVVDAFEAILCDAIPLVIHDLLQHPHPDTVCGDDVTDLLHHHGINICFLGCVLDALPHHASTVRRAVMEEMVARVVKIALWSEWRSVQESDDAAYVAVAQRHVDCLCISDDEASDIASRRHYWRTVIVPHLQSKFRWPSDSSQTSTVVEFWTQLLSLRFSSLMRRVATISGLRISETRPVRVLATVPVVKKGMRPHSYDEEQCRALLRTREQMHGHDSPYLIATLDELARILAEQSRSNDDEVTGLLRRALAIREREVGANHIGEYCELWRLACHIAGCVGGNTSKELDLLLQQIFSHVESALGTDHPHVAVCLTRAVELLKRRRLFDEAEPLGRRAVEITKNVVGKNHPDYATAINSLALVLQARGKYAEAEQLFVRAIRVRELAFGSNHLEVSPLLNNLAVLLQVGGRYSDAELLFRRALTIRETTLGHVHPQVGKSANNLAVLLEKLGLHIEAETLYKRAITIGEAVDGGGPEVAVRLNNLAGLFEEQGRCSESEGLYRRALEMAQSGGTCPDDLHVATYATNLGTMLEVQGRYGEAEPLHRQALELRERFLEPTHRDLKASLRNLILVLKKQGRNEEARTFCQRIRGVSLRIDDAP